MVLDGVGAVSLYCITEKKQLQSRIEHIKVGPLCLVLRLTMLSTSFWRAGDVAAVVQAFSYDSTHRQRLLYCAWLHERRL